MNRRDVLRAAGTVGIASNVAGCSGFLGGCGPGEDEIATLAEEVESTETTTDGTGESTTSEDETFSKIKGAIQSMAENEVTIDDGTGTAKLTTLGGGFVSQNVGSGDCVVATGVPLTPEEDEDVDVTFLVRDVSLAE